MFRRTVVVLAVEVSASMVGGFAMIDFSRALAQAIQQRVTVGLLSCDLENSVLSKDCWRSGWRT